MSTKFYSAEAYHEEEKPARTSTTRGSSLVGLRMACGSELKQRRPETNVPPTATMGVVTDDGPIGQFTI